ncbi:MAG: helix-turn-helix domain-containing protein [Candidatus Acidiferrum sp.]
MVDVSQTELLTIPETAALLRLKVSTIRAWVLQRRVPFVKLGGRVFLRRTDLQALIGTSVVPAKTDLKLQRGCLPQGPQDQCPSAGTKEKEHDKSQ